MTRRTTIKWLHWLAFGLILYFFLVEPEEIRGNPGLGLATHSGMGILLALVAAIWLGMYLSKGLAGRAGPKLPGWGKQFHALSHKVLQIGLPVTVATGAFAGLAAPFAIRAFGLVQINPGNAPKGLHSIAEEIHEIAFDAFFILMLAHAGFHIWRHFGLKDNALRIMVPKVLHKYL
ncbi:cytochrome b [Aliiroseovarius marinus]|uniref:cytochrome b n=1 Tax=Aliiroseovarius marinus TaxID=2500159 RepID=UPI0024953083|nr:cytochrome b/b6 domain-containing protein [Aliiroseovarius marinus]